MPLPSRLADVLPAATRGFRSDAALDAIAKASSETGNSRLVLYNYPSFTGAFSALIAKLFHSRLRLPCLVLPFSAVAPFRVEDLKIEGLTECYLLDFLGPPGFAAELSQQSMCQVIGFDHRKSARARILSRADYPDEVTFHVDLQKSSSRAVYSYFSDKLASVTTANEEASELLNAEDQGHVETVLKYIEDIDLRRWSIPDVRAFNIGLSEWRSRINYLTNPHMFEESSHPLPLPLPMLSRKLLTIRSHDLIASGNLFTSSRESAASKLLKKNFKVRLGGGLYGDCLGVRADANPSLTDEIGKQLSIKSAAAGYRPIGAVVYLQRNNLKMCLRSMDKATNTAEISKAYGGGGTPSSSSFIIRMDEYNRWISGEAHYY